MKVKFCGFKYKRITGNWSTMYQRVLKSFYDLGADIEISPHLALEADGKLAKLSFGKIGITDEEDAIYVYNHTNISELKRNEHHFGKQCLILKPTGPTPNHFSIDELGYASYSSLAYEKPQYESYVSNFRKTSKQLIKEKQNKWSDRNDLKSVDLDVSIPNNHVLIMGQMPGDDTVLKQSFGSHWEKLIAVVWQLYGKYPLVIKLHPTLEEEITKEGNWEMYRKQIEIWKKDGINVLYGKESLHDVLPKTKVAIVENSTAGVECMIHDVPIISYGYPEYHWITKDVRHLPDIDRHIDDLSWWNKLKSRQFLAWYCEQYLCYDQESTNRRIKCLVTKE